MSNMWLFALFSTVVVSLISFMGVFLLSVKQQALNKVLVLLVSFAVGALLGNSFFHLLPEAYSHLSSASHVAWICIAGFVVFLVIEQFLHVHSNEKGKSGSVKNYGYLSLCADGIHNFTDGILIAMAWMVTPELGVAVTITIILHEIPQEISDFGILLQAGFSRKKALLYNFYSACVAILGTFLTLLIGEQISHLSTYVLPFAAGGFIYLAATSLLPEILKETNKHNYWLYMLCILAGVLLIYYFGTTSGHTHSH